MIGKVLSGLYFNNMKSKRNLVIAIFFLLLPSDFSCHVAEGVYKAPGTVHLEDVSKRDPAVIGKVFRVNRTTGEVLGDPLFTNSGDKVKILRNVNELINSFEVMSTNKHSDVKLLNIDEHDNKITFKYYFDWLGLFLTGTCNGT